MVEVLCPVRLCSGDVEGTVTFVVLCLKEARVAEEEGLYPESRAPASNLGPIPPAKQASPGHLSFLGLSCSICKRAEVNSGAGRGWRGTVTYT